VYLRGYMRVDLICGVEARAERRSGALALALSISSALAANAAAAAAPRRAPLQKSERERVRVCASALLTNVGLGISIIAELCGFSGAALWAEKGSRCEDVSKFISGALPDCRRCRRPPARPLKNNTHCCRLHFCGVVRICTLRHAPCVVVAAGSLPLV
jgi:hypothetical protein